MPTFTARLLSYITFALAASVIVIAVGGVNLNLIAPFTALILALIGAALCVQPLVQIWYNNELAPARNLAMGRRLVAIADKLREASVILGRADASETAKAQARNDVRDVVHDVVNFAEAVAPSLRDERMRDEFQPPPPRRQISAPTT